MKLRVVVNGTPGELEMEKRESEYRFCWRGGAALQATVVETERGIYSVILDGRACTARVATEGARSLVEIGGRRYLVDAFDPRDWHGRSGPAAGEGRQQVRAPMPGKVVRVLAREGDPVEEGQGLVVVEAMKMQNELQAPRSGRVVLMAVEAGATVAAGDVLAAVE